MVNLILDFGSRGLGLSTGSLSTEVGLALINQAGGLYGRILTEVVSTD